MSREKVLMKQSLDIIKSGRKILVSAPTDLPPGVVMNRDGTFRLPKKEGDLADLLYRTREMRLDIQKRIEKLEKLEGQLRDYFIDNLPKSNKSGIAGGVARVQIEVKPVPQVENWEKFYAYIMKHKAFDLLQRRLSEGAAKERMEEEGKLPGVMIFNAKKVSCTKI